LYELTPDGHAVVATLFDELSNIHGSVQAVFANPSLGEILVDNLQSPNFAMLRGPEGLYLAGKLQSNVDGLRQAIADWEYVYPSPSWLPAINDVLPNRFMVPHERVRLTLGGKPARAALLPSGFTLTAGADPMEFSIFHDNVVVSRCSADMQVDVYAEIGIWTHIAYRGRGLAAIAASASITDAFAHGIKTVGWHCHASNKRSLKVARSLGFAVTDHYCAYSASLPAENVGDLAPERCRELARHFAAGAAEISWLDFHAAAGWAIGGEHQSALAAVERLVARGWTGKAEWLESFWAFGEIAADPRFEAAVHRHRNGTD